MAIMSHVIFYISPSPVLLIGVSYKVYLGAVISATILVVLTVSVTAWVSESYLASLVACGTS